MQDCLKEVDDIAIGRGIELLVVGMDVKRPWTALDVRKVRRSVDVQGAT